VIPAVLTHIVALLLDTTARIGVLDVFVPFLTSYGSLRSASARSRWIC